MNIKLIDLLRIADECSSIPELKIKCNIIYGKEFDVILDGFLQKMRYKIDPETLAHITIRDLTSYLGMIGNNFEFKNRQYIHKAIDYNSDYYNKHIEEYYLPDGFKLENININI